MQILKKGLFFIKYPISKISNFFKEIYAATQGKRLAVLWTIALFFGVVVLTKHYFVVFSKNYSLGVDLSNVSSNDHIFFSVKKNQLSYAEIKHGQYIAFKTDKMEPFVSKDVSIIKKVIGKEGDHVQVLGMNVLVNGKKYGELHKEALKKLSKTEAQMQKDYILPANSLFLMGSYERSYDSRYWGYLEVGEQSKMDVATPMLF